MLNSMSFPKPSTLTKMDMYNHVTLQCSDGDLTNHVMSVPPAIGTSATAGPEVLALHVPLTVHDIDIGLCLQDY